ncbi:MAG: GIY-YIG nuclease family protein, partial [Saprospiraceae bacterium]|nr:GIY-YIG nuclease family protein [Saprospiraceae bacterium]
TRYAIIDIETTGGQPIKDKITEIAIVLHDGSKVLETYSTLINPERSIPEFITGITGINNEMVRNAPKFFEVAKHIVEMTENAVFVAHSVRFDYSFIQEEFSKLGYTFSKKQLCTVKLSRKLIPNLNSYGLDSIISYLDLKVENRHRALDDALATAKLFELLYKIDNAQGGEAIINQINQGVKISKLPPSISMDKIFETPEACGVYHFYNEKNEIVYVGKSINLRKRMMEHFSDRTAKGDKIQNQVTDFSYEVTGSELLSLLIESYEIKKYNPVINRAQKEKKLDWGIFLCKQLDSYHLLRVEKITKKNLKSADNQLLMSFSKMEYAKGKLNAIAKEHQLCLRMTSIDEKSSGPCFAYHLKQCLGACVGEENSASYNDRINDVIQESSKRLSGDFLIFDVGRNKDEQSVVVIKDGTLSALGYLNNDESYTSAEEIIDMIPKFKHLSDSDHIISTYLMKKNGTLKLMQF